LPTTPAERFAALVEGFRRAIAAHAAKNVPLQTVLRLVFYRLGHLATRFARLAARIPAGAPPRPHVSRANPARAQAAPRRIPQTRPANRWSHLPRRPGWLLGFVPPMVYPARSQLEYLLADPEMAALLAASPGLRRTIRPLCRMLGLAPPASPEPPAPAPPEPQPQPAPGARPESPPQRPPQSPPEQAPEPALEPPPKPLQRG
ncbi:MAG: hypothetical protein ACP5NI_02005, partial [Acetobacteraceae bacterium]